MMILMKARLGEQKCWRRSGRRGDARKMCPLLTTPLIGSRFVFFRSGDEGGRKIPFLRQYLVTWQFFTLLLHVCSTKCAYLWTCFVIFASRKRTPRSKSSWPRPIWTWHTGTDGQVAHVLSRRDMACPIWQIWRRKKEKKNNCCQRYLQGRPKVATVVTTTRKVNADPLPWVL